MAEKKTGNARISGHAQPAPAGARASEVGDPETRRLEELRHDLDALAGRVDSVLQSEDWIQAKLYDLNLSLAALVRATRATAGRRGRIDRAPTPGPRLLRVRAQDPRDRPPRAAARCDRRRRVQGRRGVARPLRAPRLALPAGLGRRIPLVLPAGRSLRDRPARDPAGPGRPVPAVPRAGASGGWSSYPEFSSHLHNHYPVIVEDEKACVIFALEESYAPLDAGSWTARLPELITDHIHETGADPAILDWNTGLHLKESFPEPGRVHPAGRRAAACPTSIAASTSWLSRPPTRPSCERLAGWRATRSSRSLLLTSPATMHRRTTTTTWRPPSSGSGKRAERRRDALQLDHHPDARRGGPSAAVPGEPGGGAAGAVPRRGDRRRRRLRRGDAGRAGGVAGGPAVSEGDSQRAESRLRRLLQPWRPRSQGRRPGLPERRHDPADRLVAGSAADLPRASRRRRRGRQAHLPGRAAPGSREASSSPTARRRTSAATTA